MVILLLVLGIIAWVTSEILDNKGKCHAEVIGFLYFGGMLVTVVSLIVAILLSISVRNLRVIDEKIAMYQEENAKIEEQIAVTVQGYMEHEKNIIESVSPDSSITLVSLYPDLKSDTLVQSQIEVYTRNNEKIKSLKEKEINGSVKRWWLYFGG